VQASAVEPVCILLGAVAAGLAARRHVREVARHLARASTSKTRCPQCPSTLDDAKTMIHFYFVFWGPNADENLADRLVCTKMERERKRQEEMKMEEASALSQS